MAVMSPLRPRLGLPRRGSVPMQHLGLEFRGSLFLRSLHLRLARSSCYATVFTGGLATHLAERPSQADKTVPV